MRQTWLLLALALTACAPRPQPTPAQPAAASPQHLAAMKQAGVWLPAPGHDQIPIWPGEAPNPIPNPKPESVGPPPGREWWPRANDVSRPTMTVYAPTAANTGAAIVVFPGGGYQFVAMDSEGTEICQWLTARGITCILLKYRVPDSGPNNAAGRQYEPPFPTALQDAQRTLRLVRQHAAEWSVDPHKIGVIGFSAGGHMVAGLSTRFAEQTYPPVDAADALSARPDFAIALYPGHLWTPGTDHTLRPDIVVRPDTPPTFLLHAQDDPVDPVAHSITYAAALKQAGVPVALHLYPKGGHAFALRPTGQPIDAWPGLVETWLRTLGVLDP